MMTSGRRPAGPTARGWGIWAAAALLGLAGASIGADEPAPKPGEKLPRRGDEIMVCGQLFHTTAPVVLWTDPGGYDAYRVERRFVPVDQATWAAAQAAGVKSPTRYGTRYSAMPAEQAAKVHEQGWDLDTLRDVVDQFVIHYDVCGTSNRCFQVLHDARGLSVHFMLDVDGTIYQTLDLKERAQHATIANARSIGIEIANMGAYPVDKPSETLRRWYARDDSGKVRLTIPESARPDLIRNPDQVFRPSRDEPVVGTVQGRELRQYDLTPQQYDSLVKLTAALCTIFPKIECDYPRDPAGGPVPRKLDDEALKAYQGVLGHYHIQTNKTDPGPAFRWDDVIGGARELMKTP